MITKNITKQIYTLIIVALLLIIIPQISSAQLTSENFVVEGAAISGGAFSGNATSTNYDTDLESGPLYLYDTPSTPSPGGGGGGGGGKRRSISSTSNPVDPAIASTTIVIGPVSAVVGEQAKVIILVPEAEGDDEIEVFIDGTLVSGSSVRRRSITQWEVIFTPTEERQYVVTAQVKGVMASRDTDGVSDGRLHIAATMSRPSTSITPETAAPVYIETNPDSTIKQDLPFNYGVTPGCHTAFTWERGSSVTITRLIGLESSELATISGRIPWFVDEDKLIGTTTYSLEDRAGRTGEVVLPASILELCDASLDELVEVDVDGDGNAEQFIAGIFQDTDGSSLPIADTSEGLFIDTNQDQLPDVFWRPVESAAKTTSEVIAGADRYFIVNEQVASAQQYSPTNNPGYWVRLNPNTLGRSTLDGVTPRLTAFGLGTPEIVEEPVPESLFPWLKYLIGLGLVSWLINALFWYFNAPFSVQNVGRLIYQLSHVLFGAASVNKRRRPWGTVYDSVSKAPVDPAYVELLTIDGQPAGEAITDLDGRYGFLVPEGEYTMKVRKVNYTFPSSHRPLSGHDIIYSNLYYGGPTNISATVVHDVPMDPQKFDWNQYEKMRTKQTTFIHRFDPLMVQIADWLFFIGALAMVWQFWNEQSWITGGLLAIYVLTFVYRLYRGKPPLHGVVRKDGMILPFAVIRVMQGERTVLEKVADIKGRYIALVPNGTYTVQVLTRGDDDKLTLVNEISLKTKAGYINASLKV